MDTVYALCSDPNLESMQQAAMSSGPVGLATTHGLVGTAAWWQAVRSGALQSGTVSGRVGRFWPGHHGDFPEFELVEASGNTSVWPCHLPMAAASEQFRVGRTVEIDFVVQQYKRPWSGHYSTRLVTAIRLGPNKSSKPTPLRGAA